LKVLHVWDQGINYLLMGYMDRLYSTRSRMVASTEFDPFGMTPQQWKRSYRGYAKAHLMWDVFWEGIRADVVHVHSQDKLAPMLSIMGCRVVLHYHGTDIRGRWEDKKPLWKCADRILVSTTDLLKGAPANAEHLPNPIDTEMFRDLGGPRTEAALHIDYDAVDLAEKIAKENHIRLVVVKKGIPYADMPRLLNEYTHYIDVKRDCSDGVLINRPTDTGSLVGLQALASGCRVLTLNGGRVGLPPGHRPEAVAKQLWSIYSELMG
jgi:hypothetical protein